VTAPLKLFAVSSKNPEDFPMETRLIQARTDREVEKFLEAEALKKLWERVVVGNATQQEVHELRAARVKIESVGATNDALHTRETSRERDQRIPDKLRGGFLAVKNGT